MSPGAGAKKRLGVGGGVVGGGVFTLGCGCRDAKAVAVAVAASSSASPYSSATATDTTSTATTATTWRRARAAAAAALHPSSASGSTGTLTVPSASSSSFVWEDADGDAGEEVDDCKRRERERTAPATTTTSFSGLLRQLNELERSVVSWGRKGTSKDGFSPQPPPPPPPLPARPVKQRAVQSGGNSKEGHGNFSPPRPPPPPPPPPPPFQLQTTQHHRKTRSMDKADREVHCKKPPPPPPPPPPPLPLPPEQPLRAKSADKCGKKEDASILPTPQAAAPKHRKAKSCDGGAGAGRLNGTVAVVKQSDDPLSDFRRSMVNMIVENRIATGDELRELLRHFLALNAPRHHDAILRAFTEIWDEAFSSSSAAAKAGTTLHREPAPRQPTPPRPRTKTPTPPRRRHAPPPRVWR